MASSGTLFDYDYVTRRWARLKTFSDYAIEAALDAIMNGKYSVAAYFARTMQLMRFVPASLEVVLVYTLSKAAKAYKANRPNVIIEAGEVPGFDPDERDRVREAFDIMKRLGLAASISPDKEKIGIDIANNVGLHNVVEVFSTFIQGLDVSSLQALGPSLTYPQRVVSGLSSLYVFQQVRKLPKGLRVALGLISPVARVLRDGSIDRKNTIERDEWNTALINMSTINQLRDRFFLHYYNAIGILYDNEILARRYPIEVSGDMIDHVIIPAYGRYYGRARAPKRRVAIS